MPSVIRIQTQDKVKAATHLDGMNHADLTDLDTMIPLIQALIPLGLQAFAEVMQAEVAQLAGARYSRTGGQPNCVRWGRQPGSIFLADQKLPVTVQRVRDRARRQELPLQSYQQLQTPRHADGGLFRKSFARRGRGRPNTALHRMAIPLRSIAAGELGRPLWVRLPGARSTGDPCACPAAAPGTSIRSRLELTCWVDQSMGAGQNTLLTGSRR